MMEKNISIFDESNKAFSSKYFITDFVRKPKTSWQLTAWVLRFSSLKGHSKLVAAVISGFYNVEKGYAHPSYSRIIERTKISRSTIQIAIQEMKLSGEWLIIPYEDRNKAKRNNRYIPLHPLESTKGTYYSDRYDINNFCWVSSHRKYFYPDEQLSLPNPPKTSKKIEKISFDESEYFKKGNIYLPNSIVNPLENIDYEKTALANYHRWVERNRFNWFNGMGM